MTKKVLSLLASALLVVAVGCSPGASPEEPVVDETVVDETVVEEEASEEEAEEEAGEEGEEEAAE